MANPRSTTTAWTHQFSALTSKEAPFTGASYFRTHLYFLPLTQPIIVVSLSPLHKSVADGLNPRRSHVALFE
jgi:hypothetical protein